MILTPKSFVTFAVLTALAAPIAAPAFGQEVDNRLMIVNSKSGRVIYDDGRDDLFCVSRRHFVGYDLYGRRHYKRAMYCR